MSRVNTFPANPIISKAGLWLLSGFMLVACSSRTGEAVSQQDDSAARPANQAQIPAESMQMEDKTLASIHDLFAEYDRDDVPGCAVAVYQNGEMTYSGAFGMANLDYGIPLADSSRFYMASVSKQVTAAAAGLLIVRDELGYEDRVADHLEEWPEWAAEVRVKHLFNHTSGLPDIYDLMDISGVSLSNVMNVDDYLSLVYRGESLKSRPGSEFSYTNSGYTALVKLVEVISGESFAEFVESELFSPLGMTATHFHDDRTRVIPDRVISYAPVPENQENPDEDGGSDDAKDDEASPPAFRQTYLSNFQGVGPGGLYSTLKDWKHWESFWLDTIELPDDFLRLKALVRSREVVRNDTLNYAMGLEMETWQGQRMEGHSGNFMGFRTDVRRFPQHGLAVATLCNRDDADPSRKNRELAKILLEDAFESFLLPYSGSYHNEELLVDYELAVEDGSLKLKRRLSPRGAMREEEHDKWSAGSWDFVFQRDEEGRITGFLVSTGRAREVVFNRK